MSTEKILEVDHFTTSTGSLDISFIGHGSLMLNWNGRIIHVDPFGKQADYGILPKADILLVTHEHGDHMDMEAVNQIMTSNTQIIYTKTCEKQLPGGLVMKRVV